jgi:8-oxo-dGTP pyrophosphatase MutT (NUDIX family)
MSKCKNKSCIIQTWDKIFIRKTYRPSGIKKAGMVILNLNATKILLIRSGSFWGCPKGKVKNNESIPDCAVREVLEETGLLLSVDSDNSKIKLDGTTYFVKFIKEHKLLYRDLVTDVSGITWIKPECAHQLKLNADCKKILKKIF